MFPIILLFPLSHYLFFFQLKVIGGELQERLIPVPYSKSSTDQAVRDDTNCVLFLFELFFFV